MREVFDTQGDEKTSELSRSTRNNSQTDLLVVEKKEKPLPIITAKVTSQISLDRKNLDRIMFEVLTKSNGALMKSTKRTYTNFRSLDDIISAKYSR